VGISVIVYRPLVPAAREGGRYSFMTPFPLSVFSFFSFFSILSHLFRALPLAYKREGLAPFEGEIFQAPRYTHTHTPKKVLKPPLLSSKRSGLEAHTSCTLETWDIYPSLDRLYLLLQIEHRAGSASRHEMD
jgi:hypothetical protein